MSRDRCAEQDELRQVFGDQVRSGKQGLERAHRAAIQLQLDCPLNLEAAVVADLSPGQRIFDYWVVQQRGCSPAFVEVHPASSTSEVQVLVEKQEGTRVACESAGLGELAGRSSWHWVSQGGTVSFKRLDRYALKLRKAGIAHTRAPLRKR